MKANYLPHTLLFRVYPHLDNIAQGLFVSVLISLSLASSNVVAQPVKHIAQQPAQYAETVEAYQFKKLKSKKLASAIAKSAPVAVKPVKSTSLSGGFALIRQCESTNNYAAVNSAGYYGAYQFGQGTWDSTAQSAGRNDLVGVRPDKASTSDQDEMAKKLHSLRGWQPWGCAYKVGLL